MRKLAVGMAVLIALAAALAGCGSPAEPGGQAESGGQAVYTAGDTDITAKEGEKFTIKLNENPTTGYQWSVAVSDESVMALDKDEYIADDPSGELAGSGGVRVLTFKALEAGTATIDMVYERSWEPSPNDEKLQFNVTVN